MRILVLEDDELQADDLEDALTRGFPPSDRPKVEVLYNERDFRARIAELQNSETANQDIDLAIVDPMVRWTDPGPDIVQPPEGLLDGEFFKAGIRCAELMAEHPATSEIPVILYTVLGAEDLGITPAELPSRVVYLQKDPEDRLLIEKIKELTGCRRPHIAG